MFASWWITQTIKRTLANHVRVVGLSAQVVELTNVYECTIRKLTLQPGLEPPYKEVAEKMKTSVSKIQVLS